ncbi:MAG: HEPN domain-containing protein [Cyclobacteriaceae bacterium]|nr:HEPN domain-containing protein [Cyclobacteriaceae bacterium]
MIGLDLDTRDTRAPAGGHQNGFGAVSNFLANPIKNEMGQLVMQGINLFGLAISNSNLHKRIVELFTIIESFLIKDENEPILSSIIKYFPKLVSTEYEDRIKVKNMLTSLYSVRSALIHHGKQKEFEMEELAMLQQGIRVMILNCMQQAKKHETKISLLKAMDQAMDEAFKL